MKMFRRISTGLLLTLFAGISAAETITWETVELSGSGNRSVLAQGVKTYSPAKDIRIQENRPSRDGAISWTKGVVLNDTFAVAINVHHEENLEGFGLVVHRRNDKNGFSWEWFEREKGAVFQKLQGSGRVSITIKKEAGYEEIQSVEFLDDITLRYLDDMEKPPGTHTHEVIVRKGSILKVAP